MSREKLVEVFAHIAYSSTGDEKVLRWLNDHKADVDRFTAWSESFAWSKQSAQD